jgi:hypothetical protein
MSTVSYSSPSFNLVGFADELLARSIVPPNFPPDGVQFLNDMAVEDAIEKANDVLRNDMDQACKMLTEVQPEGMAIISRSQSFCLVGGFQETCVASIHNPETFSSIVMGSGNTVLDAAANCIEKLKASV